MSHQYNNLLPRDMNEILVPNTKNPQEAIECINSYIDKVHCYKFSIDISSFNIIDACYVSTMCSTKHYIKYPDGKIYWFVSSDYVKEFSKNMSLGNSEYYTTR